MTNLTLEDLRTELAPIKSRLAAIEARVDGIPLLNRRTTVIEQEVRMLRSAFNDFATLHPTSGEIQALHEDVNRVQAENSDLAHRLATAERLIQELQEKH